MRESANLEFKSEVSNAFLKTVSAYANFRDGSILFGVDDDGVAIGVDDVSQACLSIENKINDGITPRPMFSLEIDGIKKTIRLDVQEGPDKPYLYRGKAYRRSDSSTVEVDRVELNRLTLEGENLTFEGLPYSDDSLTFDALSKALHDALGISSANDDVLKTLGLLGSHGFNRAAALLADENPYSGIDIVRFGYSISEILDRTTVEHVSILVQLETAMEMFDRYLSIEKIEGASRLTKELVPREAFREAVANALVHRTWDVDSRVRVSIFPDRVEVSSPGGLPTGLSEEEYLAGRVSVLRNPLLAEAFFRLGYIEKFGTGVLRIKESYRGTQETPVFEVMENSITVALPVLGSRSGTSGDEVRLLGVMMAGRRYTRAELDRELGFDKAKTIRVLNSLVKKGLITTCGEGRARRYVRE
ncbi:ATP-binding protein [Slackia exigua]|uniref:ATP-binding protein n=1 Tax=Slackia exigua TaxID=84109 RepID=UPI0023F476C9|nr:ATP-binding protein [Slackia exigua]